MLALNESQRGEIVSLYKNNVSNHKIAKIVGVHRKTVTYTIQKYIDGKDLVTKNRSGHPKLINAENKKTLKKIVKQNLLNKLKISLMKKRALMFQLRLLEEIYMN